MKYPTTNSDYRKIRTGDQICVNCNRILEGMRYYLSDGVSGDVPQRPQLGPLCVNCLTKRQEKDRSNHEDEALDALIVAAMRKMDPEEIINTKEPIIIIIDPSELKDADIKPRSTSCLTEQIITCIGAAIAENHYGAKTIPGLKRAIEIIKGFNR